MTNVQIITGMMELNEITEEVDTYAGWRRRGFQVQKGEHAAFKTKIWKPVKDKKVAEAAEEDGSKMILVSAAFFTRSQVQAKA